MTRPPMPSAKPLTSGFFSLVLAVLLTACGGGDAPVMTRLVVHSGQSRQVTTAGDVMLVLPFHDVSGIADAVKDASVRWFYIWDEMFSNGPVIHIGANEAAIVQAANIVHAAGKKTAVTMLPEVILAPDFALTDPNALDVIGVDIYPSLGAGWNTNGCTYSANLYATMAWCSVQKLRAAGFKGEIWYVYQAFGTSDPNLIQELTAQREAINQAQAMGFSGIAAYGMDIVEPGLISGAGSAFEALVRMQ